MEFGLRINRCDTSNSSCINLTDASTDDVKNTMLALNSGSYAIKVKVFYMTQYADFTNLKENKLVKYDILYKQLEFQLVAPFY